MRMISASARVYWSVILPIPWILCFFAMPALAGSYLDSAHGNSSYGVNRSTIDIKYASYATGNCAHCHETHASIDGVDPAPVTGATAHMLFAQGFNESRMLNPYVETDDFCFYCHGEAAGPLVTNQDYSAAFGGAVVGSGPQSIIAAFNQASYHNLYDTVNFLRNSPIYSAWFAKIDNPCSACHNSHLAKRNWENGQSGSPLLSAITKPGGLNALWGETEVMSDYFSYEAPFALDATNREPAGVGDIDGNNTPDYAGFCSSCHNPDNTIWSTILNRELKKIDWGNASLFRDKHGPVARDGSNHFREPYEGAAIIKNNFVLSCMDCHEAHGSPNVMLLRRRINGEALEGVVNSTDTMSFVCKRCHNDDLAATAVLGVTAGTGEVDRWEYIHHGVADAPYKVPPQCETCHDVGGGSTPIACGNCHAHGMDDSWLGVNASGRKTF